MLAIHLHKKRASGSGHMCGAGGLGGGMGTWGHLSRGWRPRHSIEYLNTCILEYLNT